MICIGGPPRLFDDSLTSTTNDTDDNFRMDPSESKKNRLLSRLYSLGHPESTIFREFS